jgi:hypothetical protein
MEVPIKSPRRPKKTSISKTMTDKPIKSLLSIDYASNDINFTYSNPNILFIILTFLDVLAS